jgi:pilus assembly protein CpaB
VSARPKIIIASLCLIVSVGIVTFELVRTLSTSTPRQSSTPQLVASDLRTVAVVVATESIGRGEQIPRNKLALKRIEGPIVGDPFKSIADAEDAVALNVISPGQIVMSSDAAKGDGARSGLSFLVPEGMRAVALRVNDEIAVGNFLSPGDRVDVQLVLSGKQGQRLRGVSNGTGSAEARVLLQNIEVLSAGEALTVKSDGRAVRMQNVTVAVDPRDAQLLAVAKETGSFYLALRNPADRAVNTLPTVSADDLGTTTRRPEITASAAPATTRRIQVIEGRTSSMRAVQGN